MGLGWMKRRECKRECEKEKTTIGALSKFKAKRWELTRTLRVETRKCSRQRRCGWGYSGKALACRKKCHMDLWKKNAGTGEAKLPYMWCDASMRLGEGCP